MTAPNGLSLKTGSSKTRFVRIFLRSLFRIRNQKPIWVSSRESNIQRSRKIKIAAYSSMARAVGTRRAWSRAIILKLRIRAKQHGMVKKRCFGVMKNRVIKKKKQQPMGELKQADKLRRLVPGGETMEFCDLLEETAHYIKCLASQVKVMQNIADRFSS